LITILTIFTAFCKKNICKCSRKALIALF
jgi:hypothetical protein